MILLRQGFAGFEDLSSEAPAFAKASACDACGSEGG